MKKINLYKFIIEKIKDRMYNKNEEGLYSYSELISIEYMYNKEQRKVSARAEKKSLRKAALGFSRKQGLREESNLWQYGNRLIMVYDKIETILIQLDINEKNYKTIDFDLVRLATLLLIERDLIEEHSRASQHSHLLPNTFNAIIPVVHQKRPELDLKEFHKIYKEMWDYFPYKPIVYKKQELFNKLQAAVNQQNFSKEWLGEDKKEVDIGDTELHFFVDKLFKELTSAW